LFGHCKLLTNGLCVGRLSLQDYIVSQFVDFG